MGGTRLCVIKLMDFLTNLYSRRISKRKGWIDRDILVRLIKTNMPSI